jgi:hypothetical protein
VITVPTGGWTIKVYVSRAAEYDTTVTATIAAGDYFMSWDNQSDDFLFALSNTLNAAIDAAHAAYPTDSVAMWLDSDHKVNIGFEDTYYQGDPARGIKIAWTESDGDDIGKVLGFDHSADDTNTSAGGSNNKTFTADWHHGHGWYADADGWLEEFSVRDFSEVDALQSRGHTGVVRTQQIASRYDNEIKLGMVTEGRMWSDGVGYGETNVHPYERNQALECWWLQAQQGKRFRVYRDARQDLTTTALASNATASATTTLTDSARSLDIDPQVYKGRRLWIDSYGTNIDFPARFYISSHTATVFTVPAAHPYSANLAAGGAAYHVFDQPYGTYVVDLQRMKRFEPRELGQINRHAITIPLWRYVAP